MTVDDENLHILNDLSAAAREFHANCKQNRLRALPAITLDCPGARFREDAITVSKIGSVYEVSCLFLDILALCQEHDRTIKKVTNFLRNQSQNKHDRSLYTSDKQPIGFGYGRIRPAIGVSFHVDCEGNVKPIGISSTNVFVSGEFTFPDLGAGKRGFEPTLRFLHEVLNILDEKSRTSGAPRKYECNGAYNLEVFSTCVRESMAALLAGQQCPFLFYDKKTHSNGVYIPGISQADSFFPFSGKVLKFGHPFQMFSDLVMLQQLKKLLAGEEIILANGLIKKTIDFGDVANNHPLPAPCLALLPPRKARAEAAESQRRLVCGFKQEVVYMDGKPKELMRRMLLEMRRGLPNGA